MAILGLSARTTSLLYINRDYVLTLIERHFAGRRVDIKQLNIKFSTLYSCIQKVNRLMASKKNSKTAAYTWKGYINLNIPSDKIGDAENYLSDNNQIQQHLITAFSQRITVKIYHEEKSDAYKVVLMDYNPESPNYGHAMSAFGSDWFIALGTALYKHFVLSECDWNFAGSSEKRTFG